MKAWCVPLLGIWHSYKVASQLLYRKFDSVCTERIFKVLHPSSDFYKKPKFLGSIVHLLTVIRMSYPDWKDDLDAGLRRMESFEHDADSNGCKCLQCIRKKKLLLKPYQRLKNLKAFLEFFIPTVP